MIESGVLQPTWGALAALCSLGDSRRRAFIKSTVPGVPGTPKRDVLGYSHAAADAEADGGLLSALDASDEAGSSFETNAVAVATGWAWAWSWTVAAGT
jgi:hypothetical protein